jgi:hypothetical protein
MPTILDLAACALHFAVYHGEIRMSAADAKIDDFMIALT